MSDNTNNTINLLHFLNIDWIKEQSTIADSQGIPLINRFVCLLNAPNKSSFAKNGWLELQVLNVEVPNISIEPQELELNGAKRFFFKNRGDSDLSITFMETPDLLLRRFFYNWLQVAVDISQDKGVVRNYMKEYMPSPSEFLVMPLDYAGYAKYCDRFVNVFPYDISGISYNYAQAGEVIKTTVKFKYMYHFVTEVNSSKAYHISSKKGSKDYTGPDMSSEWISKRKYNI